jgi:hypothetical protein
LLLVEQSILLFNKLLEADRRLRPAANVISRREAHTTSSRANSLSTLLLTPIPFSDRRRSARRSVWIRWTVTAAVQLALCLAWSSIRVVAQTTAAQLVSQMADTERVANEETKRLSYLSEERSTRTGGHLWSEKVVETKDGLFRRLIAEDGKPLPPARAKAEEERLTYLVAHPEAFRRLNQNRRDDLLRSKDLFAVISHAYLYEDRGSENGCERIALEPDPNFQPPDYEERVLHAMAGTLLIDSREKRLCGIDAHVEREVDFAFGLLGKVNQGGKFSLTREEVFPQTWRTTHLSVHIDGRLLLMKSISRDEEQVRRDFKEIPELSLAQADAMSRP